MWHTNPGRADTTVDLLWISPVCHRWAILCKTDTDHTYSHLFDHAAILTTITLPSAIPRKPCSYRRWNSFDPHTFEQKFTSQLQVAAPKLSATPTNQHNLDVQTALLNGLVVKTLDKVLPVVRLKPTAKRWWDVKTLQPLKSKGQQLRRFAKRSRSAHARQVYLEDSTASKEAIMKAK